ncbi:MAG TPA: dCTP deaminase [archaeon]|nr:dCTP deaminase [archaeon]
MILSDFDLRNYIKAGRLMIKPFCKEIVRENGIDFRLGNEIARLKSKSKVLDMRKSEVSDFYTVEKGGNFIVYPNERILASILERIEMPTDLMGFVQLRSTYARLGLALPPTIVDANFSGQLTLEVLGGSFPVKIYAGDRFCHVIFAKLTSPVEKPYMGKYQRQHGVTLPIPDKTRRLKKR